VSLNGGNNESFVRSASGHFFAASEVYGGNRIEEIKSEVKEGNVPPRKLSLPRIRLRAA
jgi:hypothetical protein